MGNQIRSRNRLPFDHRDGLKIAGADYKVATIAALKTINPATLNTSITFSVDVLGYAAQGDGGGGTFYWDATSTEADDGGITILPTGYAGTGRWKRIVNDCVYVKWFGAKGDGVTDDSNAIYRSFIYIATAQGTLFFNNGNYLLASKIDISNIVLNNCFIKGNINKTIISGNFGYSLIRFGSMVDVVIDGIAFSNSYNNSSQIYLDAMVSSHYSVIQNTTFKNCFFSNASSNIDALGIYLYDDTHLSGDQYVDGLYIENCEFKNIGRLGCTLMNRKYFNTDPFAKDLFKNVKFINNRGINLGLQNSYGFLLSLDANGKNAEIDHNYVYNALGIGIENTSWDNVTISNNKFSGFIRAYAPFACGSNNVYTETNALTKNCKIINNLTVTPASLQSYLRTLTDSIIENNYIESNQTYATIEIIDSKNNKFSNNYWKNSRATGQIALIFSYISLPVIGNRTINDTYDTSGSSTNLAPLYFRGAGTTKNIAINPILLKGTFGAVSAEDLSAANNQIIKGTSTLTAPFDLDYLATSFITDADKILAISQYCCDYIQINTGSLSTARNVILPTLVKKYTFLNNTAYSLTFIAATGLGITIASTKTATLFFDGVNVRRLTADS